LIFPLDPDPTLPPFAGKAVEYELDDGDVPAPPPVAVITVKGETPKEELFPEAFTPTAEPTVNGTAEDGKETAG
jgi:hypothetical protein